MTKTELMERIAADAGLSKAEATRVVNSFLENITAELKKEDGKVALTGFGTFSKVHRKARSGRNPQTGEAITIKAANSVKFKPGKKLKESV